MFEIICTGGMDLVTGTTTQNCNISGVEFLLIPQYVILGFIVLFIILYIFNFTNSWKT